MDTTVLGLGAVAWTDAWKSAAPEPVLRLTIDPARLLELLKGLPVSRALLADLQKAVPSGRSVEVVVTADHEVAEIRAGGGHHLLAAAARDAVLKAFGAGLPQAAAHAVHAAPSDAPADRETFERADRPQGVLWQAPGAASHAAGAQAAALFTLVLPWPGSQASIRIEQDDSGADAGSDEARGAARVFSATLKLELPRLGTVEAHVRVCGKAVAVEVRSPAAGVGAGLDELAQALRRQGLDCAHVGLAAAAAARA